MNRVFLLVVMGVLCGLVGCEALRESERSYTVSYDADSKSGALSMTLKPAQVRAAVGPVPQPVYGLDEVTIARIVRLIEASALRNAREGNATAGWGPATDSAERKRPGFQPALPRRREESGKAVSLDVGGVVLEEMPVIGGK